MSTDPKRFKTNGNDEGIVTCNNWIGGKDVPSASGEYMDVTSPSNGAVLGKVALSDANDVAAAVAAAEEAFPLWSSQTAKSRAAVMFRFHALMEELADELADLVVAENGKNKAEALASVAKGNETVEWACSMPQLMQGKVLQVSRGIECKDARDPLGVVACCVPFNFPIMVVSGRFPSP
ncbi:unnamed protein product [Discosporangium mesarthrocarpum]